MKGVLGSVGGRGGSFDRISFCFRRCCPEFILNLCLLSLPPSCTVALIVMESTIYDRRPVVLVRLPWKRPSSNPPHEWTQQENLRLQGCVRMATNDRNVIDWPVVVRNMKIPAEECVNQFTFLQLAESTAGLFPNLDSDVSTVPSNKTEPSESKQGKSEGTRGGGSSGTSRASFIKETISQLKNDSVFN
mmetsp:Transcript_25400/g.42551  ORF Transcript_25400/g.42551 Transcript_25400/m.42551 type:complete len:189 (-) Transcript_25400:141-707(-)